MYINNSEIYTVYDSFMTPVSSLSLTIYMEETLRWTSPFHYHLSVPPIPHIFYHVTSLYFVPFHFSLQHIGLLRSGHVSSILIFIFRVEVFVHLGYTSPSVCSPLGGGFVVSHCLTSERSCTFQSKIKEST